MSAHSNTNGHAASTSASSSSPHSESPLLSLDNAGQIAAFEAYYPKLRDTFLSYVSSQYGLPLSATDRLQRMFDYNILGGKYYRGTLVTSTIQAVCRQKHLDIEEYWEGGLVAGWLIEVLQAMFLVADDIMDRSVTRRGKPCWYRLPDVQFDAINDALILESFLYHHLTQHFQHHPSYVQLMQLYQQVSLSTQMGQMLDLTSQPLGRRDAAILHSFTLPMYTRIVTYKTALYTFHLPLAAALLLTGITSPSTLSHVNDIAVALGIKFQIQDDFLDCFGLPEVIGKVGTDIRDHKCSWLVVQALQRCSKEQSALLEASYGWDDEVQEKRVKALYEELGLKAAFEQQEAESYATIKAMVQEQSDELPQDMFMPVLNKIHLRQK